MVIYSCTHMATVGVKGLNSDRTNNVDLKTGLWVQNRQHMHYALTSSTGVSMVKQRNTWTAPDEPRLQTTVCPLTYSSSSQASDTDGHWRSSQNSPYTTVLTLNWHRLRMNWTLYMWYGFISFLQLTNTCQRLNNEHDGSAAVQEL